MRTRTWMFIAGAVLGGAVLGAGPAAPAAGPSASGTVAPAPGGTPDGAGDSDAAPATMPASVAPATPPQAQTPPRAGGDSSRGRGRRDEGRYGRSERYRGARVGNGGDAATGAKTITGKHDPWSQYSILLQYNIFIRGGGVDYSGLDDRDIAPRRIEPPPNSDRNLPPSNAPAAWILRGIALESGSRVAFLENSVTSQTTWAHPGDVVGNRLILRVDIAGIDIKHDDILQNIPIGTQLDGNPAPTTMPSTAPSDSTTTDSGSGETTTPAPPSNPGGLGGSAADILERLRRRRQQELSK